MRSKDFKQLLGGMILKRKSVLLVLLLAIVVLIALTVFLKKSDNLNNLEKNAEAKNKDFLQDDDIEDKSNIEEQIIRFDDKGEVNVAILLNNLIESDENNVVFKVYLDTHSVDLDLLDLGNSSILRTGNGFVIDKGFTWKKAAGEGHHIFGYLKLPRKHNGIDILNNAKEFIELEIKNIGDVQSRLFRWDEDILKLFI